VAADQNPLKAAPIPISPPKEQWPLTCKAKKSMAKEKKFAQSA
jgi:hypothetical protein